jgi:hypothetical protein
MAAVTSSYRGPSFALFAGAAVSMVAIGVMSVAVLDTNFTGAETPRLPAVVTSAPTVAIDVADPGSVAPSRAAPMRTGMPVWPALLLAEEGTLRFAATELRHAAWSLARPEQH